MATFTSNLNKISGFGGVVNGNPTTRILMVSLLLFLSLPASIATSELPIVEVLDMEADPQVTREMDKDAKPVTFILDASVPNDARIAVHLTHCDFDTNDTIILINNENNSRIKWHCATKTIKSSAVTTFLKGFIHFADKSMARKTFQTKAVMDNLKDVTIVPNLNHDSGHGASVPIKARLTVSIYRDIPGSNNCPKDLFNCYEKKCTCCESPKPASSSRCIPEDLVCDGNPNCGKKDNDNWDEANETCDKEKPCQCQTVCLTWNYVLTSLAIAILFILTPTAIVFALFHRRKVALERARLIRMAQMRMADMRGEFTREDAPNDFPPSYDEVYEIKEPPPCFCQAVAMQQNNLILNPETLSREMSQGENLGFGCSCENLRGFGIVDEESAQDILPSYSEVSLSQTDNNLNKRKERTRNGSENLVNENQDEIV